MEYIQYGNAIKELYNLNGITWKQTISKEKALDLFLYVGKIKGLLYKNNTLFVDFEKQKPIGVECENFINALCRLILLIWDDFYKSEKSEIQKILRS
jgi:hypothetical protein